MLDAQRCSESGERARPSLENWFAWITLVHLEKGGQEDEEMDKESKERLEDTGYHREEGIIILKRPKRRLESQWLKAPAGKD